MILVLIASASSDEPLGAVYKSLALYTGSLVCSPAISQSDGLGSKPWLRLLRYFNSDLLPVEPSGNPGHKT